MNIKILSKDKDPMGAAILDYQKSERVGKITCALFYVRRGRNAGETSLQKS